MNGKMKITARSKKNLELLIMLIELIYRQGIKNNNTNRMNMKIEPFPDKVKDNTFAYETSLIFLLSLY